MGDPLAVPARRDAGTWSVPEILDVSVDPHAGAWSVLEILGVSGDPLVVSGES